MGCGGGAGGVGWRGGGVGGGSYAMRVGRTALLALAMLSVGVLISVASRRTAVATGTALFAWLALVFLSDLGLMAGSVLFKLRVQEIFGLASANPLQSFKMAVIVNMNASLDVLGPVGAYASHTLGGTLPFVLAASLVTWATVPLAAAVVLFARRGSV